jgi:hypothetical protein
VTTPAADASVWPTDLVRHEDGTLTIAGRLDRELTLAVGVVVSEGPEDARGFVVRTTVDGQTLWLHTVPEEARVVRHGPQGVLVWFEHAEGFELSGVAVAPASEEASVLALLDDAGDVVWLRVFDGLDVDSLGWSEVGVRAAHALQGGEVAVVVHGRGLVGEGFASPPVLDGDVTVLVLDAAGEPLWEDAHGAETGWGAVSIAEDHDGVLWALSSRCGTTLAPSTQPAVATVPCDVAYGMEADDVLLLGHDAASGDLVLGERLVTGRAWPEELVVLDTGRLAVSVGYWAEPVVLQPDGATPQEIDGLDAALPSSTNQLIVVLE